MDNFSSGGSHAVSVYTKREEIVYGIFENELEALSNYNALVTFFFSAGSFFMDKIIDWQQYSIDYKNPNFIIFIIFFVLGIVAFFKKKGLTDKIKKKSKPIEHPTNA